MSNTKMQVRLMFHVEQNKRIIALTIISKKLRYFVGMSMHNKIYASTIALSLLTVATFCGYAQSKTKHVAKKEKQPITIGFQTGRELLFNSSPLLHSKQSKVHYGISKSLVLRKSLNTHFKLETGLNYTGYQNTANPFTPIEKLTSNPYTYSVPVTIQYHFLSGKCKLHPFCGAGFQYNIINKNYSSPSPIGMTDAMSQNYIPQNDTKYITILFTQGVTYEVNTKIQVTQSFHFIPQNTSNIIGIDLGIGYNIP